MGFFLRDLFRIFFPESCVICEKILTDSEKTLCLNCRHKIPVTNFSFEEKNGLENSFYGRVPVISATSLFFFTKKGMVQELIHQLKYKGKEEIGTLAGTWLGEDMKASDRFNHLDCIVPVPLHPKKLRKRGYNQVSEFGRSLSDVLKIPLLENNLYRSVDTDSQTFKHRLERIRNMEGVFKVRNAKQLENKHILLIDDVVTTGSTLEACSTSLLKVSGVKISLATIAYTP